MYKLGLKILLGIVFLVLLIKLSMIFFVEPWVRERINAELNKEKQDYLVEIEKVHILMFRSGIELDSIKLYSREMPEGERDLNGEIASVKIKGIKLAKAIFKKDIYIREVFVSNSSIKAKIPVSREAMPPMVMPLNLRINKLLFDTIDIAIENTSNSLAYAVKEGVIKLYELQVKKLDTLSPGIIKLFDFEAEKLLLVSSDSMYSFSGRGIIYSSNSNTLAIRSFLVHPNYTDYDFTSRHEFQTNRIESSFSNIYLYDFRAADYFSSGNLVSSWIEIGKMDMKVFRDKRKEIHHVKQPSFQNVIYNYPGMIHIDSIGFVNANVTYVEHAEEAYEQGIVSFNEINAKIFKLSNDTIYKTMSAYLELKADALLMGKGKMSVLFKGRIYDSLNTFSVDGTLSDMDANEFNPILEKSAFVYATSGKIESLNFHFKANDTKATGDMTILYHGMDVAVQNQNTADTTAFRERLVSLFVNYKLLDSNPLPGKAVREGIIDFERDPERYIIHYCWRSLLSGFKSSFLRNQK